MGGASVWLELPMSIVARRDAVASPADQPPMVAASRRQSAEAIAFRVGILLTLLGAVLVFGPTGVAR
jgi:hypothetical protein